MSEEELPCGRCDVGVYSYSAALTALAFELAAKERGSRVPPRCKTKDRPCIGAFDFIHALNSDPEGWEQIKREAGR